MRSNTEIRESIRGYIIQNLLFGENLDSIDDLVGLVSRKRPMV